MSDKTCIPTVRATGEKKHQFSMINICMTEQHCLLAAVTAFINQIKVYYLLTQIVRCHRRCSGLLVYPTPTVTSNNDNRLIAKTIQY